MEIVNNELEKAKELIAKNEEIELQLIKEEVNAFLKTIEEKGYILVPVGRFQGKVIESGIDLIKIK